MSYELIWRLVFNFLSFLYFLFVYFFDERLRLSLCAAYTEPFWKARVVVCITSAPFFVRSVFYSRAFLCAQHLLFARLFFVRSVFYSRTILKSSRFLFARLSLCTAFSSSYSWSILKSSRSLFAHLSESLCAAFCFSGFAQWNVSTVVLYIALPLCMGESDNSFKKTLCLMNIRLQDLLLSHEPTPWLRRHQLFAPSFQDYKLPQTLWKVLLVKVHLVTVYKMWDSREVGSCVQFRIHASSLICICVSSDASAWRLAPFLCVLASASERVLVHPFWKARNPREGFSLWWLEWVGFRSGICQRTQSICLFLGSTIYVGKSWDQMFLFINDIWYPKDAGGPWGYP